MAQVKLGRKPRAFHPSVPHLSAVMAGARASLPPPPLTLDNSRGMPAALGMMLNDQLGDCTCAAFYHARQVWTYHSGKMITEPDSDVLALYEQGCGYDPNYPASDQGGVEQDLLRFIATRGAPIGANGANRDHILSFLEVDPRNEDDVKRTVHSCGVAYIGFEVPQSILPTNGEPPDVWTYVPNDSRIVGGHAVIIVGYNAQGPIVISWGKRYQMTWEFFRRFTDEVYAITDAAWMNITGKSLMGMTVTQHKEQMGAIHKLAA